MIMKNKEEIKNEALQARKDDDWDSLFKALFELFLHQPFFSWIVNDEIWSDKYLRETCLQKMPSIDSYGFQGMQEMWYRIDASMTEMGSKKLEQF